MVWTCSTNGRGEIAKKSYEMEPTRKKKRGRPKLTWAEEIRGLMGGKGINGIRLEWQRQMEEEDNIIVKWAQEDVETSYKLLNNNNSMLHVG